MRTLRYTLQFILGSLVIIVGRLFFEVRISGKENLRSVTFGRGVLIVANHKSQLDVFLLRYAIPLISNFSPLHFVSVPKNYYYNIPWAKYLYGGTLFNVLGGITFNKGEKNYKKSLGEFERILRMGDTVVLFPEGKRIFSKELGVPRGGAGYLATETNCQVLPVYLGGTLGVKFSSIFERPVLEVVIGKPTRASALYIESGIIGSETDYVRYKLTSYGMMKQIALLGKIKYNYSPESILSVEDEKVKNLSKSAREVKP